MSQSEHALRGQNGILEPLASWGQFCSSSGILEARLWLTPDDDVQFALSCWSQFRAHRQRWHSPFAGVFHTPVLAKDGGCQTIDMTHVVVETAFSINQMSYQTNQINQIKSN
jgi:hypothetical protein